VADGRPVPIVRVMPSMQHQSYPLIPRIVEAFDRRVLRACANVWYPLYFRMLGFPYHSSWKVFGRPLLRNASGGKVEIGLRLVLRSTSRGNAIGVIQPVCLTVWSNAAELSIGSDVAMSGCSVTALKKVTIGDRVMIGSGALIMDSDMHPLDATLRASRSPQIPMKPVEISDDVFIGARAIILKGTSIGARAIIGAGAVVSGEVPPDSIVGGNPGRILSSRKT
jgi:acetyltransferase-like isoleucine patch superfamily enzyme